LTLGEVLGMGVVAVFAVVAIEKMSPDMYLL
jgi:hypothetical protein